MDKRFTFNEDYMNYEKWSYLLWGIVSCDNGVIDNLILHFLSKYNQ